MKQQDPTNPTKRSAEDISLAIAELGSDASFSNGLRLIGEEGMPQRSEFPALVASRLSAILDSPGGPSLDQLREAVGLVEQLNKLAEVSIQEARRNRIDQDIKSRLGREAKVLTIEDDAEAGRYLAAVRLPDGSEAIVDGVGVIRELNGRRIAKVQELIAMDDGRPAAVVELAGETGRSRLFVDGRFMERIGGESYLGVRDIRASGDGRVVGIVKLNHTIAKDGKHIERRFIELPFVGDQVIDHPAGFEIDGARFIAPISPSKSGNLRFVVGVRPVGVTPESIVFEAPAAASQSRS